MAYRTWGRVLLAALVVGIVSGAGQLGIAYGLGLVRLDRDFGAAPNQWPAQLVWVGWFAMVATVAGALLADRLARRYTLPTALGGRAAISGLAALGALAVAPLAMQPARTAQVAAADPVTLAGVAAVLGAGVGFVAALAALSQRPVLWNLAAVTGAVWFLAILSVLPSLGPTDPLPAVRLGGVDPSWLGSGASQRLAVVTMPALALVAGAVTGALARWRELPVPVPVVAGCGVAGPLTLAMAYVVAGRGDSTDPYQAAPYWGALIAVGAGALGSALATWARWPLTTAAPAGADDTGTTPADHDTRSTSGDTKPTESGTRPTDNDAPTAVIPTVASPDRGIPAARTWRLEMPSSEPPAGSTETGTAPVTGTTAPAWTPGSAAGGRTDRVPEPSRGHSPASENRPFDITAGIPAPRPSTENSTLTERFGAPTPIAPPTSPERGHRRTTAPVGPTPEPVSPASEPVEPASEKANEPTSAASGGPNTGTGDDAELPAGRPGARRLRTEDFWPTSTAPTTPARSAATAPAAPETPATKTPATKTPPAPPAPPPMRPAPPPTTPAPWSTPQPATSARTDDAWDAFAPASRPRPDRPEPSTEAARRPGGDGDAVTSSPGTIGTGGSGPGSDSVGRTGADRSPPGGTPEEPDQSRPAQAGSGTDGAKAGRSGTGRSEAVRTGRISAVPVVSGDAPVEATTDRVASPAEPGPPESTAEPGPGSTAEPGPGSTAEGRPDAEAEGPDRPTGRIRRGLFRRNRGNTEPAQTGAVETDKSAAKQDKGESKQRETKGRNRTEEPVPARDEEYVDWVSGLSEPDPTADGLGLDRSVRRSLRSTGRHHAD
ncbi:hypothetical protein ABNF97_15600 [Plantactinospora sp. B6F1]|uniref:hypothetical protein n=1 Tax=Plantactinospora sp. B6F1 TaxID=3158971 RepID=UPI0032D90BE7